VDTVVFVRVPPDPSSKQLSFCYHLGDSQLFEKSTFTANETTLRRTQIAAVDRSMATNPAPEASLLTVTFLMERKVPSGAALKITDFVRDLRMQMLASLNRFRAAIRAQWPDPDVAAATFDLIQADPWNDERVAVEGFEHIYDKGMIEDVRNMDRAEYLDTVLQRMDGHQENADVQSRAIRLLDRCFNLDIGPGYAQRCHNAIFRAMNTHFQNVAVHKVAVMTLLGFRSEYLGFYFTLFQGNFPGISVLFQAMQNHSSEYWIVRTILRILEKLVSHSDERHEQFLEYTQSHPEWRAIIASTDPEFRPEGRLFGEWIRDI